MHPNKQYTLFVLLKHRHQLREFLNHSDVYKPHIFGIGTTLLFKYRGFLGLVELKLFVKFAACANHEQSVIPSNGGAVIYTYSRQQPISPGARFRKLVS